MRIITRAAVLALWAAPALAQGRVIDEGSFLITRNGAPAGREAFRIVRMTGAGGDIFRATAQIADGDRRITPTLSTDSTGTPVSYELAIRDQSGPVLHLQARAVPGRMSVIEQTPHGESAKEYVVPKRMLLLDQNVFHQYYFAALAGPGSLQAIRPQGHAQGVVTVERGSADHVEVAGQQLAAVRYTVSPAGGDRAELWVDSAGRVLRVAIPTRGVVVQREELPR